MILLRHLRITAFKHLRDIDLWLPRRGSVLIEGHNESGKSTLFEAIYFALYGKALVGEESGVPSLESLLPHGNARAGVHLAVAVGATELEITRSLMRGSNAKVKHEAEVRVLRPGGPVETISAINAVNDCILTEMNGLDSNVLRNSCLMEQQALDRIESLSKAEREKAIARLLGISALPDIEQELKVVKKDEALLAQAKIRLEVARQHQEARRANETARNADVALAAARARSAFAARDRLAAQIQDAQSHLDEVAREVARMRDRSARTATLQTLAAHGDEVGQRLQDAERETAALEVMRARQSHAINSGEIEASRSRQLAQVANDIAAAEAREQEQRTQIAASQRRARSGGALAIVTFLATAALATGSLLPHLLWLLPVAFVLLGVAVTLTVRWQMGWHAVADGRAKLEILERDMIRLRATYEALQPFSVSTGEQQRVALTEIAAQEQRTEAARVVCEDALRELAAALTAAKITLPSGDLALATVAEMRRAHEMLRRALQDEMARMDVEATQRQQGSLDAREQQLRETHATLAAQRESERQRLATLLAERDIAATGDEPLAALVAYWPALADAGDPEALTATAERASAVAEQLRQQVEALCRQHGLDVESLDTAECQKTYDELAQSLRQRRLAAEMADEVFRRIVQRVLPETEMHMRALLPDLTDGRYRDVTLLDGDDTSADLRIRVWDEQAGRYVGKHLFSGGTRDQCSLALRLAFALATLPKELGAMPGFIFLDEPLSSFDDRRSQALVDVLTRGPIARQFPQVFLISHSQSFDPAAFTCSLRMANGHVSRSTLPDEQAAGVLWQPD